jgi:serine protease Do
MAERITRLLPSVRWLVLLAVAANAGLWWTTAAASELRETPIVRAVQRARAAVVNIRGEKTIAAPPVNQGGKADASRRVNGMGTGVVIDPRGYVLTNHHVVDGVREIQVTLDNQERRIARLVARDAETDLAIVKIDTDESLKVIPIGTSSDLMAGETVMAVGNAYGYDHTVSVGIISALHRAVQVSEAQFYDDLIQTDASINPGNSGGPLLNIEGDMIGINVAVRAGAQGIGFAIPVDKVIDVTAKLLAEEAGSRNWHGITARENRASQVVVEAVEADSPAAAAGLKSGDVILNMADTPVTGPLEFYRATLEEKPGAQIPIRINRDGENITLDLRLAAARTATPTGSGLQWDLLGLELRPMPDEQFRQQFQTRYRGGLVVAAVRPDSPAAAQGIRRGDVLVGMHIWETVSLDNVAYIINRPDFASINPVKFYILRGEETLYGYLPVTTTRTAQR